MQPENFYYDNKIVRNFGIATIIWGIIGMTVGLMAAIQLYHPAMNMHNQYTTFGRIRPLMSSIHKVLRMVTVISLAVYTLRVSVLGRAAGRDTCRLSLLMVWK